MTLAQAFVLQLLTKGITVLLTVLLCFRNVQVSPNGTCTTGLIFTCRKWDAHWLHGVELLYASLKTSTILSLGNEAELLKILFSRFLLALLDFTGCCF